MTQSKLPQQVFRACLPTYFFLTWLHMLWLTHGFFDMGISGAALSLNTVFHATAWPFYSLLYLLPAIGSTLLVRKLTRGKLLPKALAALCVSVLTLLLIRTDGMIYDLYAFHINSFVLNLIFTPGGISSLGSGTESFISFFLIGVRVLLLQTGFLLLAVWQARRRRCASPGHWRLVSLFLALFLVQGSVYGVSDVANHGAVLDSSKVYPLFQRVRFRKLAAFMGFAHTSREEFSAGVASNRLQYPLGRVQFSAVAEKPNVIILVAESLRWDQLNATTMPNTWQMSQRGLRFDSHYSSGNGTREGLFGMFYGLYGSYWDNFMHASQSPLLMDRLQQLDYQLDLRTSASFTYPEFDKTLFVNVEPALLHTADAADAPWQRDATNTGALLDFLDTRDPARPFMEFLFFESTHAPYSFPADSALTPDYQDDVDYTQLSRAKLAVAISPLYNRYRNAAHWIDLQLARIYHKLIDENLLANTIVIITGDHGEEFMEKGAWGHNSAFVEEQTHVPLVVLLPGKAPAVVARLTSHIDIATTLLQALGADPDPRNYSLGRNLLDLQGHEYLVVSDWHSIGVMTGDLKYRIPYLNTTGTNFWPPTDHADQVLGDDRAAELVTRHRSRLLAAMDKSSLFSQRGD